MQYEGHYARLLELLQLVQFILIYKVNRTELK